MYPVENKMAVTMRNRLRIFIVVYLQLAVIFYFSKAGLVQQRRNAISKQP